MSTRDLVDPTGNPAPSSKSPWGDGRFEHELTSEEHGALIALEDWRAAMDRAGKPIPPGFVFLLQRDTVLAEESALLYLRLVRELRVPPECVTVGFDRDDERLIPRISVDPPHDWIREIPLANARGGGSARELAAVYIRSTIEKQYKAFKDVLLHRTAGLMCTRPELEETDDVEMGPEPHTAERPER